MPLLEAASSLAPSPPPGAERAGVRWGIPERLPIPTSPSQRSALGPSLSALKGGEGKPEAAAHDRLRNPACHADGADPVGDHGGQFLHRPGSAGWPDPA